MVLQKEPEVKHLSQKVKNDKDKFCVIIPDRGDRKDFTKHCLYQMSVQTIKPDRIYKIDYKPVSGMPDLIARIRQGIIIAERDGFDLCYIIENDDFYPINYFQKIQFEDYDFIGIGRTIYYSLLQKKYRYLNHKESERLNYDRSSLFCTGFRISALEDFEWPDSLVKFLDLDLWRYANIKGNFHLYYPDSMPIGIKHGIGLCGSAHSHSIMLDCPEDDKNLEWLKNNTTIKSYEFYLKIIQMINN